MKLTETGSARKLERYRSFLLNSLVILALVTVILQIVVYERTRHLILSGIILALCAVTLVLDRILDDRKSVWTHGIWVALWSFNFIINLINNPV